VFEKKHNRKLGFYGAYFHQAPACQGPERVTVQPPTPASTVTEPDLQRTLHMACGRAPQAWVVWRRGARELKRTTSRSPDIRKGDRRFRPPKRATPAQIDEMQGGPTITNGATSMRSLMSTKILNAPRRHPGNAQDPGTSDGYRRKVESDDDVSGVSYDHRVNRTQGSGDTYWWGQESLEDPARLAWICEAVVAFGTNPPADQGKSASRVERRQRVLQEGVRRRLPVHQLAEDGKRVMMQTRAVRREVMLYDSFGFGANVLNP